MSRLTDRTYQDYYTALFGELKLKISSEPDDYIIATPTDDLVKFYYSRNILTPVEFDPDKEESIDHKKHIKTIPAHERERGYQYEGDLRIECEKIVVMIPIIINNGIDTIFGLRTQSISISGGPHFSIDRNRIILEVEIKGYGINLTDEQISTYISKNRSGVESLINGKNVEIRQENEKLKSNLTQFITERKQKLDSDKNRLQSLVKLIKIPLARKDNEIVKKIQIEEKPFIKKIKPKANSEDYQLDRDKVIDIIKLISSQCFQFEKNACYV